MGKDRKRRLDIAVFCLQRADWMLQKLLCENGKQDKECFELLTNALTPNVVCVRRQQYCTLKHKSAGMQKVVGHLTSPAGRGAGRVAAPDHTLAVSSLAWPFITLAPPEKCTQNPISALSGEG